MKLVGFFEDNKILWKKKVHQLSGLCSPILIAFTQLKKDIIELSEKEPDRDNHSDPSLPETCDGLHFSMVQFLLGTTTTIPFLTKVLLKPEFLRISIAHVPGHITVLPKPECFGHFRGIPLQSPPSWENTNPRERVAMNFAKNIPPKSHCKWILPFLSPYATYITNTYVDVLGHAGKNRNRWNSAVLKLKKPLGTGDVASFHTCIDQGLN